MSDPGSTYRTRDEISTMRQVCYPTLMVLLVLLCYSVSYKHMLLHVAQALLYLMLFCTRLHVAVCHHPTGA
jgi:hypothetical protein